MNGSLINLSIDLPAPLTPPFPERPVMEQLGHVHFIGIGGAGMSAVARLMLQAGMTVNTWEQMERVEEIVRSAGPIDRDALEAFRG